MKISAALLFLVSIELLVVCNGYRILSIYPFTGKSHFIMINGLLKGLARRGHQVDLISALPKKEKTPNYTQIITLHDEALDDPIPGGFQFVKNFNANLSVIATFGYKYCEHLGDPKVLNLIRNPPVNPPYDAIILHMMSYQCYMAIAHAWNIPVVLVSTTSLYPWMHDMIGNPENIAFSPNNMAPIPEGNTFWARFCNTYWFYKLKLSYLYYTTNQNELLQKYFGSDIPSLRDIEKNASLVLMNTYFPLNGAKPMATNLVEVGGLHIRDEGPPLSNNLKTWLDESKNGVIYFTLGSMFRIETFPNETVELLFKPLEKLKPMRVLIRIAKPEELTVKLPSNFYTLPWIPQEKVLQHPNVKLFITHGGLLGTQESIYYGVPMLCLPLFADQYTNSQNYVGKKIAVLVDILSLTEEKFENALNEILHNPMFMENVKRISHLFRDRPQSAMDTANFWIEFVIRNGKDSMRSPVMDLTWWQVALLDAYAATILGLVIIFSTLIFVLKTGFRKIFCRKTRNILKEKKRI